MKKIFGALLAVTLLFAACNGASNQNAQNEPATSTESAAVPGGTSARAETFIFAQGADPRGLDPAYVDDGESAMVMCNVYEGLTKYNEKTTAIEPALASDWQISDDGLVYTFNLRQGVKFHDGSDFTAEVVKYNIERQLPPNDVSNMPYAEFTFGYVEKVEAVSDYVVEITLKQPSTPFLANLAMTLAAPIPSKAALEASATGNLNESPVGTGPFKFVKWEKGVSVTLERNEEYWGEKAKLKSLIIQIIPENSVRASSMMTKAIDGMNGLDAVDVESVKASGANIFEADGMNINYMAFNTTRAPFDNKALREAIVRAVNVEELVPALYLGYSEIAYSVLPKFIPGYAPDVKPYAYDPEKAKEILTAEGAENLEINIITYSNPRPYNSATGTRLAEAIQGYLAQVGVTVNITQYDWTTYKEKVSQGEGDIRFYGWTGDNGDPDNFLNLLDDNNTAMNVSGYHNPEFHDLILKAVATPNGPERDKLYQQMEAIVAEDAVWLPFSHAKSMAAYAAGVEGFFYHPTGSIFFQGVSKN